MAKRQWRCARQQAGHLVKEFREKRPWHSASATREELEEMAVIEKARRTVTNRKSVDRVELLLALFGWTGSHHTLTYDNEHLPPTYADVQRSCKAFIKRARRHLNERPFDYIYCIEGRHGDHRYHIHVVLSDEDFSSDDVKALWRNGNIVSEPALKGKEGYRPLAKYFVKERTDGIIIPINRHPWVASQTLYKRLPPAEIWYTDNGRIDIPDNILFPAHKTYNENAYGAFNYASYILKDS